MENDERWSMNESLNTATTRSLIDPRTDVSTITSTMTTRSATIRQKMQVPINGNQQQQQQRSIGKSIDYLPKSDDESTNSLSSSYNDDNSLSSEDGGQALRDRGNDVQRMKNTFANGSFVPEGVPLNAVATNEGFFAKVGGKMMPDDELHQVPASKAEELELRILRQPEEQHRARYMSEGSRGSVKDRSGKSHCTVALRGYNRPTVLEIYAAIGSGAAIPHPLYRLIPVTGKNGSSVTSCKEALTADGTPCLQVVLRPENKMTAVLDCIGILKICSYDLKRKLPKQNRSASVRLVFRVTVPAFQDRRQNVTLQTVSLPIVCAQQPGYPDVSRISCTSSSVRGNVDVFIVGKNFSNNAAVYMKEYGADGKIIWTAPATVDQQHIHTCHMICTVPAYRDLYANKCVEVTLTVECGKKISRPLSFKYLPDNPIANTVVQEASLQQMAYNPSYALDGLNGNTAPTDQHVQQQQQNYQKYEPWPTTDFSTSIQQQQQDQQQQYQQQQQQLLLTATAIDQKQPLTNSSVVVQPPTLSQSFADFVDPPQQPAPARSESCSVDEQNASFYFSNQFDKPPPAKRHCADDAFSCTDPFFALEDLPPLLTN